MLLKSIYFERQKKNSKVLFRNSIFSENLKCKYLSELIIFLHSNIQGFNLNRTQDW